MLTQLLNPKGKNKDLFVELGHKVRGITEANKNVVLQQYIQACRDI